MGFVADAVSSVFDVVSDVVSDVVDVVSDVVSSVVDAVGDALSGAYQTVADVVGDAAPIVLAAGAAAAIYFIPALAPVADELSSIYATVSEYVGSFSKSFGAFLEAIHFSTILEVNSLAMLVSKDYRQMMTGVYSSISELSSALGFAPQFIALAFRNARAVVLDASSAVGKSYDIGEITWLNHLNETMSRIAVKAKQYKNKPGELFSDLDDWIVKPAMDSKAKSQSVIIKTLGETIKAVEDTAAEITTVRSDMARFIKDLPEDIRKRVEPMLSPIFTKYDNFINSVYAPKLRTLDAVIANLSGRQNENRSEAADLIKRLKRPGDYLSEVNYMPRFERRQQEDKIAAVAMRSVSRTSDAVAGEAAGAIEQLASIQQAKEVILPIPEGFPKEIPGPQRPAAVPPTIRKTWFVGDY